MHRVALLLLVGAVALTVAKAPSQHCCSAGDRNIVQKQWRNLFDNQDAKFRESVGRLVLLKLIEAHSEVGALFEKVDAAHPNGPVFTAHSFRVFNALDLAINLLGNSESLDEALDHLSDQHAHRAGVKKEYFTTITKILHNSLSKLLDRYDWTAWRQCLGDIIEKLVAKLEH